MTVRRHAWDLIDLGHSTWRRSNDDDYVALRNPATRLSLFVRGQSKDSFAYLGEVRSAGHEQFSNQGRAHQRYNLALQGPSLTASLRN